ncbi:MAG TPA: plastocyanin [Ideonella sp.]|uniref:plastocyanin n=1 Tax=Ideonella sp. TaxID=1929293 RepID=UPI002E345AA1|nr:plastocyanin [Ideonella sp.]HEX5687795.1 plastocyanin [Ideonella sp.]
MPLKRFSPARTASCLLITGLTAMAQAGTLDVNVLDRDGQPAADVVVLVQVPNQPSAKPAAAPVVIAQQDLRFQPFLTVVPVGSTLRFVNKDGYDHHVRSVPSGPLGSMPAVEYFELRLDGSGAPATTGSSSYGGYDDYATKPAAPAKKKSGSSTADVKVDRAGPIGLGCHIHGSMRGQVYVSASPWFAKTDAKGVAHIEGVPDGAAEVVVWHPDQLQDQASVKVQVGAAPAKVDAALNFTPKRRRS